MTAAKTGCTNPLLEGKETAIGHELLVDMGIDLQLPTDTIIDYTEKLLDYAETEEDFQDFIPDLNKMLAAGQQLSVLIIKVFSKKNHPNGKINLEAFGSTIRHDLRTPINAFIGYSEMLLEDINEQSHADACGELRKILVLARRLLNLINDLSYLTKPGTVTQETPSTKEGSTVDELSNSTSTVSVQKIPLNLSENQVDNVQATHTVSIDQVPTYPSSNDPDNHIELLAIGVEIQTLADTIINNTKEILGYANSDEIVQDFVPDLNKMLMVGGQLSHLIIKVFSKRNHPNGELNLEAFGSTIRHDLRTPINAFIGYSEMMLEDIEEESHSHVCLGLQQILSSARRLLSHIDDLSHLSKKTTTKTETPKKETEQSSVDNWGTNFGKSCQLTVSDTTTSNTIESKFKVSSLSDKKLTTKNDDILTGTGKKLQTPTLTIIEHITTLFALVEQTKNLKRFTPDIEKMLTSSKQLLHLMTRLFSKTSENIDAQHFDSTIRHDLRTPINAIIGYSEMMLEDTDEENKPIIGELQQILSLSRKLLNLINDLTNFSVSEASYLPHPSNPPTLEKTGSPTLMDQVVRTMYTDNNVELVAQDASLLVVDDKDTNRDLLSRRLEKQGFRVEVAENGLQALKKVRSQEYDLVLLDIIMPEMNGYQVLEEMKKDDKLRHIPVIMISALDEIDSVVRCIEMGAEDYLQKPFNQVILKAKISASLDRKRLRDREHAFIKKLQIEQEKSEKLLLNILPKPIADRLKKGVRTIADSFPEVTVLFSDLVGFTEMSAGISPVELVEKLNEIFLAFDILAELHGLEKIKTIGDSYMLVGGLPTPRADHAEAVADMAIDMFDAINRLNRQNNSNIKIRVGFHTGSVVAGVIGKNKFNYDLWGDAVNVASRMESHGVPGKIQVSEAAYFRIKDKFILEKRGPIEVKGKGEMVTYFLVSRDK